ncbi:MAG: endonuclease/exonuclease/phosphatase family protein [Phycisphaerales bacterium]|nr:endonuclease/exonuclease/phosphatase family protein [Phycisphaerales bacterium]
MLLWNVLHGGNDVEQGPEKALRVIRETDADLVLLQESYDIEGDRPTLGRWLAGELAGELGDGLGDGQDAWRAHQGESPHLCVLTRLEIEAEYLHHPWHGVGARVTDGQGRSFVAWSIWLDSRSYITWDLRDNPGISDEELVKAESERSGRLAQTTALLAYLGEQGFLDGATPLLVGGDFNTPSHLDWTADTARVYLRRRALALPVSLAFEDAGFTDVFRAVYPNPVQHPGITWSPMFRDDEGRAQGFERIDRLYVMNPENAPEGGSLRPVAASVLPEVWEDEAVPVREREFPSDHGAVLIELEWE